MKTILVMMMLMLVGCSEVDPNKVEHDIGMGWSSLEEVCIDGVIYYIKYKHLAVGFNADSTVKTCN